MWEGCGPLAAFCVCRSICVDMDLQAATWKRRTNVEKHESKSCKGTFFLWPSMSALGDFCQVSLTDVARMWFIRFLRVTRFQHAVGGMGAICQSRLGITSTCCRRNRTEGLSHLPHTPLVPNATRRVSLSRLNESIIYTSSTTELQSGAILERRCDPDEDTVRLTDDEQSLRYREDDDDCKLCATAAVQRDQRRFKTPGVQIEQTLQYDCHAASPPILSGWLAWKHHIMFVQFFSKLPSWEKWLGRCWWLRDLSRRSCRKDPDLGSFVDKSAIQTQHPASWVPFGYLTVTVGSFRSPQPCSIAPTLTGDFHVEQRESCKRVTKFVNLAFADTENPTVFSALRGAPLRWL